jgi:hypothetical protein
MRARRLTQLPAAHGLISKRSPTNNQPRICSSLCGCSSQIGFTCAHVVRQPLDVRLVELDEIAGRIADVEIIHGDPEVVMLRRLDVSLIEVKLGGADREPPHRNAEVRRGDRLGTEQLDVELDRRLQVPGTHADVVDLAGQ